MASTTTTACRTGKAAPKPQPPAQRSAQTANPTGRQTTSRQPAISKAVKLNVPKPADGNDGKSQTPAPAKPKAEKSTPSSYRAKRAAKQPGVYLADEELVAAIRKHASEHYNDGGWDVVIEAWDDAKIISEIGWTDQLAGALRKLAPTIRTIADVTADRMADARNSA